MGGEEIRVLLSSAASAADAPPIPVPPNMTAIPAAAVVAAGADPTEVEAWVRGAGGWPKRVPPMFMAPDATAGDLLFFVVPDRELRPD